MPQQFFKNIFKMQLCRKVSNTSPEQNTGRQLHCLLSVEQESSTPELLPQLALLRFRILSSLLENVLLNFSTFLETVKEYLVFWILMTNINNYYMYIQTTFRNGALHVFLTSDSTSHNTYATLPCGFFSLLIPIFQLQELAFIMSQITWISNEKISETKVFIFLWLCTMSLQ